MASVPVDLIVMGMRGAAYWSALDKDDVGLERLDAEPGGEVCIDL